LKKCISYERAYTATFIQDDQVDEKSGIKSRGQRKSKTQYVP